MILEAAAWLADMLERMVSGQTKAPELARLLAWNGQAKLPHAPEHDMERHADDRKHRQNGKPEAHSARSIGRLTT